ncbi:MAG: hypothetical protein H0W72_04085 [Planctomycetes bacterium]|nr:hypothetical protein [Planctomycetota bacterium]
MRSALLLLLLSSALVAADAPPAPVAKPTPKVEVDAKDAAAQARTPEEEKWQFEPPLERSDVFEDIEKRYELEAKLREQQTQLVETGPKPSGNNPAPTGQDVQDAVRWGGLEVEAIETYILARKWDEAMARCDSAVKRLAKFESHEAVRDLIERIKRFRSQAEEAKAYEEAQAKFDALNLKIEGILWSPEGSLAVISGEPRARAINDRVKDCVIINIDTNRVDFLFHHNRRRFEFQRYVGEDAKSAAKNP